MTPIQMIRYEQYVHPDGREAEVATDVYWSGENGNWGWEKILGNESHAETLLKQGFREKKGLLTYIDRPM